MFAPLPMLFSRAKTPLLLAALLAGAALSTGCAQQQTNGYYEPPGESTITDAQAQGAGSAYRPLLRAPSQVQIALKDETSSKQRRVESGDDTAAVNADGSAASAAAQPAAAASAAQNLIPQAQTYMGTLPCFTPELQCDAQRVTITLAPNGLWRGRSTAPENTTKTVKPYVEQGCWDASDERPSRVRLMDIKGNPRAEFIVTANNMLRLRSVAGQTPNLNYNLTRQPDLDPIDELAGQAVPSCP